MTEQSLERLTFTVPQMDCAAEEQLVRLKLADREGITSAQVRKDLSYLGSYGTRGVVINNASTSGHAGFAGIGPYAASKHAVIGLTKSAAWECTGTGVRVSTCRPRTQITSSAPTSTFSYTFLSPTIH